MYRAERGVVYKGHEVIAVVPLDKEQMADQIAAALNGADKALAALISVRDAIHDLDMYESNTAGCDKTPFELVMEAINALKAKEGK